MNIRRDCHDKGTSPLRRVVQVGISEMKGSRLSACAFLLFWSGLFSANKGGRAAITRRALHFPLVDTSSRLPAWVKWFSGTGPALRLSLRGRSHGYLDLPFWFLQRGDSLAFRCALYVPCWACSFLPSIHGGRLLSKLQSCPDDGAHQVHLPNLWNSLYLRNHSIASQTHMKCKTTRIFQPNQP